MRAISAMLFVFLALASFEAHAAMSCEDAKLCYVKRYFWKEIDHPWTYVKIYMSDSDGNNKTEVNEVNKHSYANFEDVSQAGVAAAKALEANGACRYLPGWY